MQNAHPQSISSVCLSLLLAIVPVIAIDACADAQTRGNDPDSPPGGKIIHLEVTTHLGDGQIFEERDPISFLVSSDLDAYLLLIYQDAANNLIQLLPNALSGKNYFLAGDFVSVPGENSQFSFTVSPPFGIETLYAFASSQPFPALSGNPLQSGLRSIDYTLGRLKQVIDHHNKSSAAHFGEANLQFETRAGTDR